MPLPSLPEPSLGTPTRLGFGRGGRWALPVYLSLLAFGLFLFFWLPTRISVAEIYSESYLYGFSNHAGQRILAVVLVLGFFAAKALHLTLPPAQRLPESAPDLGPRTLIRALLITLFFGVFLYWLTRPAGGVFDGAYFMDRIRLIEQGRQPYRDFEWVYGSLPLYGSLALSRLLHVSSVDGYNLLVLFEVLLGVVLLWFGLRLCDLPSGGKRVVFLAYIGFSLTLMTAVSLNYTLLRYSLPLFCIAALTHIDVDSTLRTRLLTGCFAFTSMALLLGLSPEEGLAFAAATAAFLPLRRLALRRPFLADTVLLLAAFAAAVAYAAHTGLFTSMKTFGAGAFNLPLWPDPPLLLLLVALFVVGAFLATGSLRQRLPSNVTFITIFSLAMLAGALGRADVPHIIGYELSLLATALLLLWKWPKLWRAAVLAFVLIAVILPPLVTLPQTAPLFSKVLMLHLYRDGHPTGALASRVDAFLTRRAVRQFGPELAAAKLDIVRKASGGGAVFDPHVIFTDISPIVFVPFAYRPNKLSVYQSPSLEEGYYFGEASITSVATSERKLDDLRAHPERDLLLSYDGFNECAPYALPPPLMRQILLYPFVPPIKHEAYIFVPICKYIESNYYWLQKPSTQTFGYGLMRHF